MKLKTWSELKTIVDAKSLSIQYVEHTGRYDLVAMDGALKFRYAMAKDGGADQVDFETNYKSSGNGTVMMVQSPFASKKIGDKSLFKRVHGTSASVGAGATVDIDFVVPYPAVKFTGAEIFNTDLGDVVDFTVHDDVNNTYSGAPGSYYQLNQFGYSVQMPAERYKNTSNYDADLYQGMIIRCAYTNNTGSTKTVAMNVWLHEVK